MKSDPARSDGDPAVPCAAFAPRAAAPATRLITTGPPPDALAVDSGVSESAWRALAVFRALTLVYAVGVNLVALPTFASRRWCLATLAVMIVWSAFATYAFAQPRLRRWPLFAADMTITILTVLATLPVKTEEDVAAGGITVPAMWAVSAALAWALQWRLAGGMWGAVVLTLANVVVDRGRPTLTTMHSLVIVFLATAVIGYVMRLAQRAEAALADAVRIQSATAERERLSREIHDGVLQVLALVRRELRGDAAELGRLASEQEASLRALISTGPSVEHGGGVADLRELLAVSARSPHVHLATPATPVLLPVAAAQQLSAAVSAALHNVKHHVGAEADAWVLVEATVDEVVVTVRDDGPGIPAERLAEAAQQGRLGVAQSIVGRLRDLGGVATITSAPNEGTEVELRVPR